MFVGDLGNEVNDETLTLAFKQFSSFHKAKVIRERWSNKTKGYGFVSFLDSADMVAAMKAMNGAPTLRPPLPPLPRALLADAGGRRRQVHRQPPVQAAEIDVEGALRGERQEHGPDEKEQGQQAHEQEVQGHNDTLTQ